MSIVSSIKDAMNGFIKPVRIKRERSAAKLSTWTKIKRTYSFIVTEELEPPPVKQGKKTLVLDLDETLIHSSKYIAHPDVESFRVEFDDEEIEQNSNGVPPKKDYLYVQLRPGVKEFLDYVNSHFDVFIFTYGVQDYADKIIDALCPQIDKEHRYYRDSCELRNHGKMVHKDLDIFHRPLTDLILVDDNISAQKFHPDNSIQIQQWKGTPNDRVLTEWLMPILVECESASDVRKIINSHKPESRHSKRKSAPI
ncbi:hypothetical protein M9Y10_021961 [Tritrichomonas musculus]|uniref:Mitochondrial import inner membrane translocase subunit TIM50 n=1 Tax=Tritrichomonas musculus TaxID=1915356 RepID=A0ABR2KR43_9EUKA